MMLVHLYHVCSPLWMTPRQWCDATGQPIKVLLKFVRPLGEAIHFKKTEKEEGKLVSFRISNSADELSRSEVDMKRIRISITIVAVWLSSGVAGFAQPLNDAEKTELMQALRDSLLGKMPELISQSKSGDPVVKARAVGQLRALATVLIPDTLHPHATIEDISVAFRRIEGVGAPAIDPLEMFIANVPRIVAETRRRFGPAGEGAVERLLYVRDEAKATHDRIRKSISGAARGDMPVANNAVADLYERNGAVDRTDEKDSILQNSFRKVFTVKLQGGKRYQLDLKSAEVDSYLRIEDANGRELAYNDDAPGGGTLDSRLVFTAPKSAEYRVIATTYIPGQTGRFRLTIAGPGIVAVDGATPQTPPKVDARKKPTDGLKADDKEPSAGGYFPNPYSDVKVGDWLRFEHTDFIGKLTIKWHETRTVTYVDAKSIKLKRVSRFDDGKEDESSLTIDRTQPIAASQLLDYGLDQKVTLTKSGEGRETRSVGEKSLASFWINYRITTPGFAGDGQIKVWRARGVPLSGIVRLELDSGFSGTRLVSTLVGFGSGQAGVMSKKAGGVPEKPAVFATTAGPKMVRIPAGEFEMGSIPMAEFLKKFDAVKNDLTEIFLLLSETPPIRKAKIERSFMLGSHEITIGEFRAFVKETGYVTSAEKDGQGGTGLLGPAKFGAAARFTWKEVGFPVTDDHPVANVSWHDANAYCVWLSKKTEKRFRLPTEAEWEYACRAGAKTTFAHGNNVAGLIKFGNLADQALRKKIPGLPWALQGNDGHEYLAPVGKFQPNAFGLYDMHGNVLEWCADRFSFFDPIRNIVKLPLENEVQYVHRGGNWFSDPATAGCACRSGNPPSFRNSLTGFRVVCEIDD